MAKVKKSPEEKLVGQIDKLLEKNLGDNSLIEKLSFKNSKISQTTDTTLRREINKTLDLIEAISACVQRRSRLLKKKSEKLSELRTMNLPV